MEPTTFCSILSERTRSAHQRAESGVFITSLLAGRLDVRSLVRLLDALLPVYDELEAQLPQAAAADGTVALFDHRRLDRAPRLRADLRAFGHCASGRQRAVTREYVEAIRASTASPQRLLAHHYTRYLGDLAGGQVIRRLVERHYDVAPQSLTYYDFSDLGDLVHYRRQYRALLELVPWSPTEQAEFIAECALAYDLNARLFAALAVESGIEASDRPALSQFLAAEQGHVSTSR